MDREKRRLLVTILFLIPIILIGDIVSGAIGLASGPVTINGCNNPATVCQDQISLDTTVFGNNTVSGAITTGSWTATRNETMVVVASIGASFFRSQVSSVTDLLGDLFTRQIQEFNVTGSPDFNALEVWTGKVSATGTNTITATWNETSDTLFLLQASMYFGVASIGAKLGTSGLSATGNTVSIQNVKSGSWIFGVSSVGPGLPPCNIIVTSPSFVRRLDGCSQNGVLGVETELSDNATALRDLFTLSYAPTWSGQVFFEQALLELVSIDSEPLTPDFTTFCTVTVSPCMYLNMVAKVTGPNSLVNIVVGTAYCTGVTSSALTSTKAGVHTVSANGQYNAQSRNDTGAVILVQLYTSANAPSTVFGAGLCATGGSIVSASKITFDTSGAALTAYGLNEYYAASIGTGSIGGTGSLLYCWYEITPQSVGNVNTGVGNLGSTIQYAQWGSHSNLQLTEIR